MGKGFVNDFLNGCMMELQLGQFSPYFSGMKFNQAAEYVCSKMLVMMFKKLAAAGVI